MMAVFPRFFRRKRWGEWIVGPLLTVAVMAGCAQTPVIGTKPQASAPAAMGVGEAPPVGSALEQRLRAEASRWLGMAHRLGGEGADGVDCSGLVKGMYRNLFGIQMPRTTLGQVRAGTVVSADRLKPGDLVFFRIPEKKLRHVGIYLGRGEFVHASASQGVTVSDLDSPYWQKAFWTARRIL